MNQKKNELFKKVLEHMEWTLREILKDNIEDHDFDAAHESLDGLKHINGILDNFGGKIDHADMKYVADDLLGVDRDDVDNAAGIIESCMYQLGGENEGYTYEDMSVLIEELENV